MTVLRHYYLRITHMNSNKIIVAGEHIFKYCPSCKQYIELIMWYKLKSGDFTVSCKNCKLQYRQNNKEYIKSYNIKYHQNSNNQKEYIAKQLIYRQNNKERIKYSNKQHHQNNKEYYKYYNKQYYQDNKNYLARQYKQYQHNNKERITLHRTKYRQNNKEYFIQCCRNYTKNQYKNNIKFRITKSLRARLNIALKSQNIEKINHTFTLIGCSINELKQYIESKFANGMTWQNYGKWHIDHIMPCVSFKLEDPIEQNKCFHYTNLQPLWAEENMAKGGKI